MNPIDDRTASDHRAEALEHLGRLCELLSAIAATGDRRTARLARAADHLAWDARDSITEAGWARA